MATLTLVAAPRLERRAPTGRPAAPAPRRAARPTRTARPAGPARTSRRSWALTRRGRVVVLLLAVVVSFLVLSLGRGAAPSASTTSPSGAVAATVVVAPGQTLWAIARELDPAADPRATIERLREMNSLTGDRLTAGQTLLVPARG